MSTHERIVYRFGSKVEVTKCDEPITNLFAVPNRPTGTTGFGMSLLHRSTGAVVAPLMSMLDSHRINEAHRHMVQSLQTKPVVRSISPIYIVGVGEGIRTLDTRSHSPEFYH